jgi:hypothetical protein
MKTTFWLRSGIAYLKQPLAPSFYYAVVTVRHADGKQEPAVLTCNPDRSEGGFDWGLIPGTDLQTAHTHGEKVPWAFSGRRPDDFADSPDYFAPWEDHENFLEKLAALVSRTVALQDVSLVKVRASMVVPLGPRHRVAWRRLAARVRVPAHFLREPVVMVDRSGLTGYHLASGSWTVNWRQLQLPLLLAPRSTVDASEVGSRLCAVIDALPLAQMPFVRRKDSPAKQEAAPCATTTPST